MRTPLRAGVIGAGFVGGAHVEAIRRTGLAEVSAVAASTSESAIAASARHHVPKAHARWQDLVDDPSIDVVHNCTPNHLHDVVAAAALEHGKHLITEKPLATSSDRARRLVKLGEQSGVIAAVCQNYRHYPMTAQARALIAAGEIGEVHHAHGGYLQDWLCDPGAAGWRLSASEGGPSIAFADIGTHWCDLVCHLLDDRVDALVATTGTIGDHDRDDHAGVLLRFARGTLGTLTVSQVSPGRKNSLHFQIDGSEGSIAWDQERPDELRIGRPAPASEDIRKTATALAATAAPLAHFPPGHTEGWNSSFKNLFLCVYRTILGEPVPGDDAFATLADGLDRVRLVEAVIASNRSGAWTRILDSGLRGASR